MKAAQIPAGLNIKETSYLKCFWIQVILELKRKLNWRSTAQCKISFV